MEKELPACPKCGKEQDSLRGDFDGRECYRCRSTDGLMAGLCLEMEANGADLDHIEGWPAIRPVLRKQLGAGFSDAEYLKHLKDILLADHAESDELMLRMNLEDVVKILTKTDTGKTFLENIEITEAARYVREQRKLIASGKRPNASKKDLIAEKWPEDESKCTAMGRELQPSRFGWMLEI